MSLSSDHIYQEHIDSIKHEISFIRNTYRNSNDSIFRIRLAAFSLTSIITIFQIILCKTSKNIYPLIKFIQEETGIYYVYAILMLIFGIYGYLAAPCANFYSLQSLLMLYNVNKDIRKINLQLLRNLSEKNYDSNWSISLYGTSINSTLFFLFLNFSVLMTKYTSFIKSLRKTESFFILSSMASSPLVCYLLKKHHQSIYESFLSDLEKSINAPLLK